MSISTEIRLNRYFVEFVDTGLTLEQLAEAYELWPGPSAHEDVWAIVTDRPYGGYRLPRSCVQWAMKHFGINWDSHRKSPSDPIPQ